jgi:DNA-binding MarR family transcriptional regulator
MASVIDSGKRPRHSVNYWVHTLASSLVKGATAYYGRRFDITLPEMRILSTLHSHGDMPARDLVKLLAMDKGMVSRVLAQLAASGRVELLDGGQRARLRRWTLTPSGRAFVSQLQPVWLEREARIQAGLTSAEHDQLVDMLERLFWASEKVRADEQALRKRPGKSQTHAREPGCRRRA